MDPSAQGSDPAPLRTDPFTMWFTAPSVVPSTDLTRPVRSVILPGNGSLSGIKVTEAPLPKAVCDDHVEVQVRYCGLNFFDNYLRLGFFRNRNFPLIMGSECSGIITAVGKNVTDLKVGQKVLCMKMMGGLFRHFVHVERKYCFTLPDDVSLMDAVGLGLNFVIAFFSLRVLGWPENTLKIFMQSIAGGLGTAVIQITRAYGNVDVLGTASQWKHDKLRSLGVKRVYRHQDDYVGQILKDYPGGIDLVIHTRGSSDVEMCVRLLKPLGALVLVGSNFTVIYPQNALWAFLRSLWPGGSVSSAELIAKNCCISGLDIGLVLDIWYDEVQRVLDKLFEFNSSGKLKPCIHTVLPFDRVANGMMLIFQRENIGKVIIEVKEQVAEVEIPHTITSTTVEPQSGPSGEQK